VGAEEAFLCSQRKGHHPMFDWLSPAMLAEIDDLARRYGPARFETTSLDSNSYLLGNTTRTCEVCMVIRRPNGRLLTMKKTFYPDGAYRLPTGGIDAGESILGALEREIREETNLTTTLLRFLGALAYHTESGPRFATFIFLLQETGGVLQVNDPGEQLEAFREIALADLPGLIEHLSGLEHRYGPEIESYWDDWGRFRVPAHQLVWEQLQR
jgi:8-oxo-dGTP pyrophosphatase MutT (NUDIX family)